MNEADAASDKRRIERLLLDSGYSRRESKIGVKVGWKWRPLLNISDAAFIVAVNREFEIRAKGVA